MRVVMKVFALALLATLAGCDGKPPAGGALAVPVFVNLQTADKNGNWIKTTTLATPANKVLPARARGVRIDVTAPVGTTFGVSLRSPPGQAPVALPENTGTPAADAGYFQVLGEDPATSPPVYHLYVRAPAAIADPNNYAIEIVAKSLRTDVTDSPPLTVDLHKRDIFTVTVAVHGSGHVVSTPNGIECGTSPSGQPMTQCTFDFSAGLVQLMPNSNQGAKFLGWTGNCAPTEQTCNLALAGLAGITTSAEFGASTDAAIVTDCPAAPALPGLRWIDEPECATHVSDTNAGINRRCDAQGYFCCQAKTGASSARCGGGGQLETVPDCMQHAPTGMLKQPGGCYEVDTH